MVRIIECEQNSDAWRQARTGVLTASVIPDLMAKGKSGAIAAGRKNLAAKLIAEQLTGRPAEDGFQSEAMRRGKEMEGEGILAYAEDNFAEPVAVGFCLHDDNDFWGCSPDRFLGDDGLIEVKCPNVATHLSYLTKEAVPSKYYKQIQWQLHVTGRKWCDFVSYDPRLPREMQLYVERVVPDRDLLANIIEEARILEAEVVEACNRLREQFGAGEGTET